MERDNVVMWFLFYVLVSVFVVLYWRGTWILLDIYLYPEDLTKSAVYSVAMGYVGFILLLLPQMSSSSFSSEKQNANSTKSYFVETVYTLFGGFVAVNSWRGVWYLADDYIFVDNRELSGWVSVFLGVVVLCMIAHFQSVLAAPMTILSDRSDRRVRWSNALQKPIFGKHRVGIDNGDCESTGASSISNITLSETSTSDTEAGPYAAAGGSL